MSVTIYNREREHERVTLMIEMNFGSVVNMDELRKLDFKGIELLSRDLFYYGATKDAKVLTEI